MAKTLGQKLCTRSRGYAFVRNVFACPALHIFYRKIDVIGARDVPDKGPVIFATNHQNALMDAIAILCTKNRQPVFVARADIFRKPLIISILHFLRILPIFRRRDGGSSFDNNRETFSLIVKVLHGRQAVGIMPEGTHNEIKRLGVLQKGIFRLAMQVQETYGNRPAVKIIPTGLEYSDTRKFRSDLTVNYGKAIDASDFYDLYAENPAKAFKQMQDTLSGRMKEGMINIENGECYAGIERLRVLYLKRAMQRLSPDCRQAKDRLKAQQKIIAALQDYYTENPDRIRDVCRMTTDYYGLIGKYGLCDGIVERQPYPLMSLLGQSILAPLGIPFWLPGMLFGYLPYKLSDFASRKVKDPQFISSVRFVAGIVLYPLYFLVMTVLLVIFVPCIWGKVAMPLLMAPLGLFAYRYCLAVKQLSARWRFWSYRRGGKHEILYAADLRKCIFEAMDDIMFPGN